MWRLLFWPAIGLAAAIAVAVLVLVNTGIIGTRAVQIVVTLASPDPDQNGQRVQALTGAGASPRLPPDVARRLEEASRKAAATREPQTIHFSLPAAEYERLSKVTSALGAVEPGPADSSPTGRQQVAVSLTIRPATTVR